MLLGRERCFQVRLVRARQQRRATAKASPAHAVHDCFDSRIINAFVLISTSYFEIEINLFL
uniref:Uncharacterized protein n=1 Tax=Musa balbisiana TaxID=52838 RepID=E1UHM3_MUSBA|nr:Hypothetical protein MbP032N20cg430 [Musa balbisiana]